MVDVVDERTALSDAEFACLDADAQQVVIIVKTVATYSTSTVLYTLCSTVDQNFHLIQQVDIA